MLFNMVYIDFILYIYLYIPYIFSLPYISNIFPYEGFPLTGYFIPGRVGSWVWLISRVVRLVVASRVARAILAPTIRLPSC